MCFLFFKGETDAKNGEKSRREYADSQGKKNTKPRNRSNSRKNIRTSGPINSRVKNQDAPTRLPGKPKKSYDSKPSSDYKESKFEISVPLFKGTSMNFVVEL